MVYEVNTDQVSSAAVSVQGDLDTIVSLKSQMFNAVSALNSTWEGEAHDAYVEQSEADGEAMAELCDLLQEGVDNIKKARETYDNCDNDVAAKFKKLSI